MGEANVKKCSSCGEAMGQDAIFCAKCGSRFEEKKMQSETNVKKCSSCGTTLELNAAFCPNCGSPVAAEETQKEANINTCSSCGTPIELNAAFCPNCGNRVEKKEAPNGGGGAPVGAQLLALANDFLAVREVQPARFEFSSETGAQSSAQKVKIKYDAVAQLDPENKLLTFWEKMVESSVGTNMGFYSETHVQKGIDVTRNIHGQLLFGGKYGFEYGKLREVVKAIAEEQGWKFKLAIFEPKMNAGTGISDSKKSLPSINILITVLALLFIIALGAMAYRYFAGGSKDVSLQPQTPSQTQSQTELQQSNQGNTDVPPQSQTPSQTLSQTEPGTNNPENTDNMQSPAPKAFQRHGSVAGGRPFVETDKDIYTYGERIKVHFYNAPGYSRDWICIVRAGSRHTAAGNYQYIPRGGRGVLSFRSPRPGRYEARAYYSYSPSQYTISARHSFTVVAR